MKPAIKRITHVFGPLLTASALALAATMPACAPTDATQCAVDSECASILGVTADQALCSSGVCLLKTPVVGFDAGPQPNGPVCKTNLDCGAKSLCRSDKCVAVVDGVVTDTSDFSVVSDRDPIVVGFVIPLTKPNGFTSGYDKVYVEGVKLAADDWNLASGGGVFVPGANPHPILAAFCDSQLEPSRVKTCLDHLVGDLKAPAVVFRASDDVNAGIAQTVQAGALTYCSDCEPSDVVATATNNLLWFGTPALDNQTDLRVRWGSWVESQIRTKNNIAPGLDIKVAYLSTTGILYDANLKKALKFNGKAADQNENAGKLMWRSIDPASFDWHALGKDLATFAPDVIVVSDLGRDFHAYLVPEVEAQWHGTRRPYYIASESESFDLLQRTIGGNEGLRRRISGVWSSGTSPEVVTNEENDFEPAFQAKYGYRPHGVATGFESFYAISYALTAAMNGAHTTAVNSADLTGAQVAAGLGQLVGGPPENIVDFKPSEIARGIDALQRRQKIDARGVYSDLEWDPITGLLQGGAAIWCVNRLPDQTIDPEPKELWVYDWKTKAPDGVPNTDVCGY